MNIGTIIRVQSRIDPKICKCKDIFLVTSQVMKLPSYMELVRTWPELMLKINLFLTGATDAEVADVIGAHKGSAPTDAADESTARA